MSRIEPVDAVNAHNDDGFVIVALRTREGWHEFRLPLKDADQLEGMLYLLVKRAGVVATGDDHG